VSEIRSSRLDAAVRAFGRVDIMVNNADVEIPTQRPDESFAEKPAMPSLTPQRRVPRALTSLRVSPARMDGGPQPATVSVTAA